MKIKVFFCLFVFFFLPWLKVKWASTAGLLQDFNKFGSFVNPNIGQKVSFEFFCKMLWRNQSEPFI